MQPEDRSAARGRELIGTDGSDTRSPVSVDATTELRALLAQEAVHDPPWHVADDDGQPYIYGKRGPGWYDNVADEVSNEETAKLIVAAVNALPDLLDEIDRLREQVNSGRTSRERAEGLPEGTLPRV